MLEATWNTHYHYKASNSLNIGLPVTSESRPTSTNRGKIFLYYYDINGHVLDSIHKTVRICFRSSVFVLFVCLFVTLSVR